MTEPGEGLPLRTDWRGCFVHALRGMGQAAVPFAAALYGGGAMLGGLLILIPLAGVFIGGAFGFSWLAWWRRTYVTGAEDIRLEHGLISRSARSVPYERIQDVSLEQKLLPRLLGLAEVKFETGAGGKDEIALAYVTLEEGERLRELVRRHKQGDAVPVTEKGVESNELVEAAPLFAMDTGRILTFGLFEFSLIIFGVLMGVASQLDFLFPFDLWNWDNWLSFLEGQERQIAGIGRIGQVLTVVAGIFAVILLGVLTGMAVTFAREYGFRLDRTDKGFRRRRGLFNKTDVILPAHRVQAARIETGLIRKRFGWHSLKFVSLAQDGKGSGDHPVAPFAHLEEIWPVARAADVEPPPEGIAWNRPMKAPWLDETLVLSALFAIGGIAASVAFAHPAPLTIALVPIAATALANYIGWRLHRHASDAEQLYVRHGTLAPKLAIAPQVKLQSAEIVQGPLARRRGHATLHLGLAGGTLSIPGLPLAEAKALRQAIVERIAVVDYSALPR